MPTKERADKIAVRPDRPTIAHVLVPLGSSTASDAAVRPAAQIAGAFGARLHLVSVGTERAEADAMAERTAQLSEAFDADVDTRVDWDVPGSILDVAGQLAPALVCMASHARGRLGELAVGSYTTPLLAQTTHPVVLVGPDHGPERRLTAGPVLACVDGSAISEKAVALAAGWADVLGVALRIVTVAEPTLAGLDGRAALRFLGPREDPELYVARLADSWRRSDLDVSGLVVYDPIGTGPGLASHLETGSAGLLVVTTHARTGLRRALYGSSAAAIVRHSPVPVLVVPPHA